MNYDALAAKAQRSGHPPTAKKASTSAPYWELERAEARGRLQERKRIKQVLALPEAKGWERSAMQLLVTTEDSPSQIQATLQAAISLHARFTH